MNESKAQIARAIDRWRVDPVNMVRELFQVEPDAWQAEGLTAFATDSRLAVKRAKGLGKTTLLAFRRGKEIG